MTLDNDLPKRHKRLLKHFLLPFQIIVVCHVLSSQVWKAITLLI